MFFAINHRVFDMASPTCGTKAFGNGNLSFGLLVLLGMGSIGCAPAAECEVSVCDDADAGPNINVLPQYRVAGDAGTTVDAASPESAEDAGDIDMPDANEVVDAGDLTEPSDAGSSSADAGYPSADAGDFSHPYFQVGNLDGEVPADEVLLPLPGAGTGGPVLTSNNPELITGSGLLYSNARPSLTRGGQAYTLSGSFGVYLHHLVSTSDARPLWVQLVITNPNATPVEVSVRGSGYSQNEVGGLALGASPDYRVSEDWILDTPDVVHENVQIEPGRPFVVWKRVVNHNREVDGRFAMETDAPVYVYVVATEEDDINEAVTLSSGDNRRDAPGDYRISGTPPPDFGREAGVYAFDTWSGTLDVDVPATPSYASWMVNTATGQDYSQVQAFPALAHLDGSARESVGMYGNVYDLYIQLRNDGNDGSTRRVRLVFSSLSTANISRYWDGAALVDGNQVHLRHTPAEPSTTLTEIELAPGQTRTVHFQAMVPGLTSISQALSIESLPTTP